MALPLVVVAIGLGSGYLATSFFMSSAHVAAMATSANDKAPTKRPLTLGAQTPTASPQTTTTPTSSPAASVSATQPAPTRATVPSACSSSNYTRPAKPSLQSGLNIEIETPVYYSVGTDSPSELISLVHSCGQKQPNTSGYDASTSYNLAWSYSVSETGGGMCKLSDIRVGIRINQLLPALEASRPATVQTMWSTMGNKLYAHEQQHVAIDTNAARSLYTSLGSVSESCQTISNSAQSITQSHVSTLQADNDSLDSTTHHGQL